MYCAFIDCFNITEFLVEKWKKPCKESLSIKCLTVSATGQSLIDSEMKMNVGAFHCRFDTHEHSLP